MKLLFILDPLEELKAYKDTSVAMMRAAQARGHEVFASSQDGLRSEAGKVRTHSVRLALTEDDEDWFRAGEAADRALAAYDAVLMRKDPPFDLEYLTSLWLLTQAEREGARVFNDPAAVRDHNEKLGILEFPQFIPPTLCAREPRRLHAFIDEQQDVILKRLDGMGGESIFRVRGGDPNRGTDRLARHRDFQWRRLGRRHLGDCHLHRPGRQWQHPSVGCAVPAIHHVVRTTAQRPDRQVQAEGRCRLQFKGVAGHVTSALSSGYVTC